MESTSPMDQATGAQALRWRVGAPVVFLLLWSSGFVFLKLGLAYADPLTFLALRYAAVVAILLLVCAWRRPRWRIGLPLLAHLVVTGLFVQAGYFVFTYLSMTYGLSAGAVALVTSQQPILIGLLAPLVAHERVSRRQWLGLVLGVCGAAMVILARSEVAVASAAGLGCAVFALLCMTGGTLWQKRGDHSPDLLVANLVQYMTGLAVALPLAFFLEPMHVQWTPGLLVSLTYLVLGNSLLAISLLLAMVRRGEASRVSSLFFLVPPATALIAFGVLGETLSAVALVGMIVAAAGVCLVMRRPSGRQARG